MAEPAAPKTPRDHFISLIRDQILALSDADLDFGVYRILRHRRDAIERFLTEDLPARLDAVTKREGERAVAALEAELVEAKEKVYEAAKVLEVQAPYDADGALNPEIAASKPGKAYAEKVQKLERLKAQGGFSRDEEADLYHHLFVFFSRYYRDGDFLPQPRRSRRARYVVEHPQSHGETDAAAEEATESVPVTPYNGQDVHLHWRSRGMHYAKTSEHFRVYRATEATSGQRLRFEIVSAEVDRDNAKAGEDRFFVPLSKQARTEDGVLVVPFEYRALTPTEKTRLGKKKKDAQDALISEAVEAVKLPAGITKDRFEAHLRRYARRNQRDYFIHPALGPFLREELDYYLKGEYLDLSAVPDAAALADRLAKLHALREVGGALISLLDGIETFQARLFEKRRFVFASDYLVPVHLVPEALHAQVIAEPKQVEAWRRDLALEGDVTAQTLKERPTLVVDTRYFRRDDGPNPLRDAILGEIEDIDAVTDGLLVYGENYGALRTLTPLLKESVKCTYIDPPYNTGGDDFLYKDDFARHSTWLTMMEERLSLARTFLSPDGSILISHDNNEYHNLRSLMGSLFSDSNFLGQIVWKGSTDNNPTRIATEHEYVLSFARDETLMESTWESSVNDTKQRMIEAWDSIRKETKSIDEIQIKFRSFIRENSEDLVPLTHYNRIDADGPYTGSRKVHNPGKEGYRFDVIHPVTGKVCVPPARGYRFPESTYLALKAADRILFGPDESQIIQIKEYLKDYRGDLKGVVNLDGRVGANVIEGLFGSREVFRNPKPVELIAQLLSFASFSDSLVSDFFAGSGTTGHAVIATNRADGGQRRFVLSEMGDHFWTILIPRITKVMYAPDWREGKPTTDPVFAALPLGSALGEALPEWVERSPRLVQIVTLESYDDSLDALSEQAADGATLFDASRLEYVLPDATGGAGHADVLLNRKTLETPFAYALRILTPEGEKPRAVDLIETTNFALGLRVRRRRSAVVEGRPYVAIEAKDPEGRETLVLWRTVDASFKPAQDAEALAQLALSADRFERVLVNADAALPGAESLDPLLLTALISRA